MMGGVSNKVVAATAGTGVAGAITIILTYLIATIWKVEIPSEVAQAMTVVISTIAAGASGWLTPHGQDNG